MIKLNSNSQPEKSSPNEYHAKTTEVAPPKPNDLFTPRSVDATIKRTDIPALLPEKIKDFGVVHEAPAEYDPGKPNFYIVATQHGHPKRAPTESEKSQVEKIQEDNVKIFHVLRTFGVQRQFLEGNQAKVTIDHDKKYPDANESPLTSLPKYKETGKIKRAWVAVEGIYEGQVESIGVEDMKKSLQIDRNFMEVDRTVFVPALAEMVAAITAKLNIPFNSDMVNQEGAMKPIFAAIRAKSAKLSQKEIQELINIAEQNPKYQKYLDAAVERYYDRIPGRNQLFAKEINDTLGDKKDAAFIVGALHSKGLQALLKDWNVFIVSSPEIKKDSIDNPEIHYTRNDYRKTLEEGDLYMIGIQQEKPKYEFFKQ